MRERAYQNHIIKRLGHLFPGSLVLKNDPAYIQGIPDLSLFWEDRWAMLEVKADSRSAFQPNQQWYLKRLNEMSFAAVVHPENEEEVLDALQSALRPEGAARFPEPQQLPLGEL